MWRFLAAFSSSGRAFSVRFDRASEGSIPFPGTPVISLAGRVRDIGYGLARLLKSERLLATAST
jgi:hypothetical protein